MPHKSSDSVWFDFHAHVTKKLKKNNKYFISKYIRDIWYRIVCSNSTWLIFSKTSLYKQHYINALSLFLEMSIFFSPKGKENIMEEMFSKNNLFFISLFWNKSFKNLKWWLKIFQFDFTLHTTFVLSKI